MPVRYALCQGVTRERGARTVHARDTLVSKDSGAFLAGGCLEGWSEHVIACADLRLHDFGARGLLRNALLLHGLAFLIKEPDLFLKQRRHLGVSLDVAARTTW